MFHCRRLIYRKLVQTFYCNEDMRLRKEWGKVFRRSGFRRRQCAQEESIFNLYWDLCFIVGALQMVSWYKPFIAAKTPLLSFNSSSHQLYLHFAPILRLCLASKYPHLFRTALQQSSSCSSLHKAFSLIEHVWVQQKRMLLAWRSILKIASGRHVCFLFRFQS